MQIERGYRMFRVQALTKLNWKLNKIRKMCKVPV